MPRRPLVVRALQSYWRLARGLTLGAQGAVIDAGGRFLLVRHGYRPGWHFPGGGVERNEAIEVALRRELAEEAGIELAGDVELHGLFTNFTAFPSDHVALFIVREWRQPKVPTPNAEIAEHGFFAPDRLPDGTSRGTRARIAEITGGARPSVEW